MSTRGTPGAGFGLHSRIQLACLDPDHLDPVTTHIEITNRHQRRIAAAYIRRRQKAEDKRQRQKEEANAARGAQ
jgi:hypothetical protein